MKLNIILMCLSSECANCSVGKNCLECEQIGSAEKQIKKLMVECVPSELQSHVHNGCDCKICNDSHEEWWNCPHNLIMPGFNQCRQDVLKNIEEKLK